MRFRQLAPRRQLVVRILVPFYRDVLLVLLSMFLIFKVPRGYVFVCIDGAMVGPVGGWFEVLVVVGWGGAGGGAAHCWDFVGGFVEGDE